MRRREFDFYHRKIRWSRNFRNFEPGKPGRIFGKILADERKRKGFLPLTRT
jgi:hypothetical protein